MEDLTDLGSSHIMHHTAAHSYYISLMDQLTVENHHSIEVTQLRWPAIESGGSSIRRAHLQNMLNLATAPAHNSSSLHWPTPTPQPAKRNNGQQASTTAVLPQGEVAHTTSAVGQQMDHDLHKHHRGQECTGHSFGTQSTAAEEIRGTTF